jgi:hypothetical protein
MCTRSEEEEGDVAVGWLRVESAGGGGGGA